MTPLPEAEPVGSQPSTATRIWDILLKLSVPAAVCISGWVNTIQTRVSEMEYVTRRNAEAISRLESQNTMLQLKFDRLLELLETIGNRLTRIETKLEQPK
jgi:hypothetical protein